MAQAKDRIASGYVSDVESERRQDFTELEIKTVSFAINQKWNPKIFNAPLSKEFREKYREKFGEIDSESLVYKRNFEALDSKVMSDKVIAQTSQRRSFAEYMTKRVIEFHVDNHIKSDPEMRPIYETKEKLSKIEVAVNEETKLNAQYSFSANELDLIVINPYCDSKVTFDLGGSETRLIIGRALNRQWRVNTNTLTGDGITQVDFIRPINSRLVTVWGGSTYFKSTGTSVRESRVSAAMNYVF